MRVCLHWWLCLLAIVCACAGGCGSSDEDADSARADSANVAEQGPNGNIPHRTREPSVTSPRISPEAGDLAIGDSAERSSDMDSAGPPVPEDEIPTFQVIGAEHGFEFTRYDDLRGQCRIMESTGGGVGLLDIDADGLLDVMLTDGCRYPEHANGAADDDAALETGGRVFRNHGSMFFVDVTAATGIRQLGYGQGCAVGDYDGDGFDDLYVTCLGRNSLWRNNGDGTFTETTDLAGAAIPLWSTSAAFADVNGDGLEDLYVANYLKDSPEDPTLCPSSASPSGYSQCPPSAYEAEPDYLLINRGDGSFLDASDATGISAVRRKGLGVVIVDLDGRGLPEIYVANDGEANSLFVAGEEPAEVAGRADAGGAANLAGLRYQERGLLNGAALSRAGFAQASMGIASGDINGDGQLDLVLTHFYGDSNTVYENLGDAKFEDTTRLTGLAGASRQVLGWGVVLRDFNSDGVLDLFVANGHVEDRSWAPNPEPFAMQPQLFLGLGNGRFAEVSAWAGDAFAEEWKARGVAAGDLDGDGQVDLVVSRLNEPAVILKNQLSTAAPTMQFRLVGTKSNRKSTGSLVELLSKDGAVLSRQWLVGGGSFLSASDNGLIVKIPQIAKQNADLADFRIRVQWPSGQLQEWPFVHRSGICLQE